MNRKVTVVGGAGNVGATVARSIAEKGLADVVIIDIAETKAAGVALDIYETCPIIGSDSRVIGGSDWSAAAGSDIVVDIRCVRGPLPRASEGGLEPL